MNFDTIAAHWDDERRMKRAKVIAREIMKTIGPERNRTALEFGCGTGLISMELQGFFQHITLMDSSAGMLAELSRKIKGLGITNMTTLHGDIATSDAFPPFAPFDVIFSSMVLHHVEDIQAALHHIFQLLAPGGCVCIIDLMEEDGSFHAMEKDFNGHNGFNPESLCADFEKAGFRKTASHIFYTDVKPMGDKDIPYSLFILTARKDALQEA